MAESENRRAEYGRARGPDPARVAREKVQARLGLVSAILWAVLAFGAVPLLGLGPGTRALVILALGFGALLVAALPWLAYRRLVEWEFRRSSRPEPRSGP